MSEHNHPAETELPSWIDAAGRVTGLAAIGLSLGVLLAGAWAVFPCMDDAWLTLLVKEQGVESVSASIRHRPVLAALWTLAYRSETFFFAVGLAGQVLLWLAYAAETAWLWRLLFPEWRRYAVLPACLVLAPVVAATHLTTLVVLLPINLPAVLVYGGLLLLAHYALRGAGRRVAFLLASAVLIFAGLLISEFAIAPVLAALALLGGVLLTQGNGGRRGRAWIAACVVAASGAAGHVVFRLTADFSTRPDAAMDSLVTQVTRDLPGFATNALSAIWWSVIGGPATALGAVRVGWWEKSTVAGCLCGGLLAGMLLLACRRRGEEPARPPWVHGWRRLLVLLAALCGALWPEFVRQGLFRVGRYYELEALGTRFFVTALPVAACLTVWLACCLAAGRLRVIPVAMLGLLIGNSTFIHSYSEHRKQHVIRSLGVVLRPYVEAQEGVTVAVLPDYYGREYELVFKATRSWPPELSRRLFILWEGRFPAFFGQLAERSGACPGIQSIDARLSGIVRKGDIGRLLFVEARKDGTFNVEPYCVVPSLPPASAAGAAAVPLVRTESTPPMRPPE